jgi:hypothetical protein
LLAIQNQMQWRSVRICGTYSIERTMAQWHRVYEHYGTDGMTLRDGTQQAPNVIAGPTPLPMKVRQPGPSILNIIENTPERHHRDVECFNRSHAPS